MTKIKGAVLAVAVGALALLPTTHAMAAGCPDYDNPCDIQPIDPLGPYCAKFPKLPC